ncbi:MAG TPA: hypothetical protein VMU82_07440 [Acetobacteraceae bacterium]|nr:hypothetical protein [Acetobacteraceae bacterium]
MVIRRVRSWPQEDDQEVANRRTAGLASIAFVLALVIVSLQLVHILRRQAALEDCLLDGRITCGLPSAMLPR